MRVNRAFLKCATRQSARKMRRFERSPGRWVLRAISPGFRSKTGEAGHGWPLVRLASNWTAVGPGCGARPGGLRLLLLPAWFRVLWSLMPIRQITIGLLVGLKIAYGVVLVGSLIGAIVLGGIFWLGRRRRMSRPMVARGLLLCGTCLIGLALAEAVAAAWRAPARSMPAPPAGDPALPSQFAENDDNEVTIVVIGESSAAGAPFESWLSVGEIVAWKLGEAIPGRRFRALVLAHPGDTLETQYHNLARLRRRPDAVIVYCGHNEFSSRIPWSRKVDYYRDDEPPLPKAVGRLAGGGTPLLQPDRTGARRLPHRSGSASHV